MVGSASSSLFQWGEKVKGSLTSYESMHYEGIRYDLHDCVFARCNEDQPWVGKLMRLYEEEDGVRKVRIRWFMRLGELPPSVKKTVRNAGKKEVYIAQGGKKGVENENVVEVVLRKAIVLCCWNSPSNPRPSPEQLERADHFFKLAYDVSSKKLKMISEVERTLVSKLVNKPEWLRSGVKEETPVEVLKQRNELLDAIVEPKKRPRVHFSPLEFLNRPKQVKV